MTMPKSLVLLLPLSYCLATTLAFASNGCEIYSKLTSKKHVMCEGRNRECHLTRAGVSEAERERILYAHNVHREQIAMGRMKPLPSASNIKTMMWDEELATLAQTQAQLCKDESSCSECRIVERFSVGQLVFKVTKSVHQKKINWDEVVHYWFEQFRNINPKYIHHYDSKEANNSYAQVAWAKTNKIGCGFSMYQKNSKKQETQLYICNYGPAGLEPGRSIYKIGEACTQCQEGTQCPSYHGSLCMNKPVSHRVRRDIFSSLTNITEALPTWLDSGSQYPELMSCNFNSDCPTKSMGSDSWLMKQDPRQGNYYEVTLKRGGNAVLFILNGIPPSPSGSACLTFKYRKSTQSPTQRRVPLKIFSWSLMGPPIETVVTHDSPSWTNWKVQIPDLKGYAIVIFHVSLPNNQFYESLTVSVDDVKIVAGDCI